MKKQTFVSYLEDSNGKMINFERWNFKKVSTIQKKLKELYTNYKWVYNDDIKKSKYLTIYATPDGYNKEKMPIVKISIEDLGI